MNRNNHPYESASKFYYEVIISVAVPDGVKERVFSFGNRSTSEDVKSFSDEAKQRTLELWELSEESPARILEQVSGIDDELVQNWDYPKLNFNICLYLVEKNINFNTPGRIRKIALLDMQEDPYLIDMNKEYERALLYSRR